MQMAHLSESEVECLDSVEFTAEQFVDTLLDYAKERGVQLSRSQAEQVWVQHVESPCPEFKCRVTLAGYTVALVPLDPCSRLSTLW